MIQQFTNYIEIAEQHINGTILMSTSLSMIEEVYIFPIRLYCRITKHCRRWRVIFQLPSNIKKIADSNQKIQAMYKSFENEQEAKQFFAIQSEMLKVEIEACKRTGGILVSVNWLYNILSPAQLNQYIRFARSLGFIKMQNSAETSIPLNPYFLGIWLGDGSSSNADITTMDVEILVFLHELSKSFGPKWHWVAQKGDNGGQAHTYTMRIIGSNTRQKYGTPFRLRHYRQPFFTFMKQNPTATLQEVQKVIPLSISALTKWRKDLKNDQNNFIESPLNPLRTSLSNLHLLRNKHIPELYFRTSRQQRLQLLAGLLDTDGYLRGGSYEIMQKSIQLASDIQRLAMELGYFVNRRTKFATCTNGTSMESKTGIPVERLSIFGLNLDDIPCLLERKQCKKCDRYHLPMIGFSNRPKTQKRKATPSLENIVTTMH